MTAAFASTSSNTQANPNSSSDQAQSPSLPNADTTTRSASSPASDGADHSANLEQQTDNQPSELPSTANPPQLQTSTTGAALGTAHQQPPPAQQQMTTNVKTSSAATTANSAVAAALSSQHHHQQQVPPSISSSSASSAPAMQFLQASGGQQQQQQQVGGPMGNSGHFPFSPFMHHQLLQKASPGGFIPGGNYPPGMHFPNLIPGLTQQSIQQRQLQQTKAAENTSSSPKRSSDTILSNMCNRSQRCGVCKGCTNSACGRCSFCLDSPQFGGPGVKKQSCLERRCHRVLENKLQRDAPSFRARRGCGQCEDCRADDCESCLVCFDKKHFENRYIPTAMCARKRCNHAVLLDNTTRMRPQPTHQQHSQTKKRPHPDNSNDSPLKRPNPAADFARMQTSNMQGNGQLNGNSPLAPRLMAGPNGQLIAASNRFHPLYAAASQMEFPSGGGGGFQPIQPQQQQIQDPNANRVFANTNNGAQNGGMCLFPLGNGQFVQTPQTAFLYSFPQPLQPTATSVQSAGANSANGKDIKEGGGSPNDGSASSEDPYQPPSYNQESNGSVVLQAL